MATGGEAVGRLDDGRVVFVRGALPGEVVDVEITDIKKRFSRGVVADVHEASGARVEPPCDHAHSGACGGCDWMYIDHTAQLEFKRQIAIEQLQRLGGVAEPDVVTGAVAAAGRGQRTTVRCVVRNGRAGYRASRSETGFAATMCGAAHPLLEELILDGRFDTAEEVTLRAGANTGERMAVVSGPGVDLSKIRVPADVLVVADSDPGDASITEEIAGRRWRVSAKSFFQTSAVGAEDLVAAVARGLADSSGAVVDLYAGVGLLGGGAAPDRIAMAVESNPSSVADARHNLGDLSTGGNDVNGANGVTVEQARVERWKPQPFGTVIADPARRGLGADGTAIIDATRATSLVLVSCDPASLGRDTALLIEQGWCYDRGEVIDMFPDTSRIEVVSTLTR